MVRRSGRLGVTSSSSAELPDSLSSCMRLCAAADSCGPLVLALESCSSSVESSEIGPCEEFHVRQRDWRLGDGSGGC